MWNANPLREVVPIDWAEIARALRTVWLRSLRKPETAKAIVEFNTDLWRSALQVWHEAGQRWLGLANSTPTQGPVSASADKRFAAPEWHTNPVYRTLKEVYLLASDWLMKQADAVDDDLDEAERQRINFHLRQFVDAMSPTLMLMSNPAALHKAIETGGASVVAGARNLMADLNAGRLTMVDAEAFAPGRNLALTPGKVVHRNRLIELIQYSPSTEQVHKTPLLILPPWINKFYILDMQPKNSMIRYLVGQGFTVFVISWKNPDASMDDIDIEDYMDLGPLEASDVAREITGSPHGQRHGVLHRRHAADADARDARRQGRRPLQRGELHGVHAGFCPRRRHGRVHGRAGHRPDRAADDGARLSRQPRDVQHVQPAALERPDLVERGQQLSSRQQAAGLRPPVLERRRHPDDPRRAQLVPAQHLSSRTIWSSPARSR